MSIIILIVDFVFHFSSKHIMKLFYLFSWCHGLSHHHLLDHWESHWLSFDCPLALLPFILHMEARMFLKYQPKHAIYFPAHNPSITVNYTWDKIPKSCPGLLVPTWNGSLASLLAISAPLHLHSLHSSPSGSPICPVLVSTISSVFTTVPGTF